MSIPDGYTQVTFHFVNGQIEAFNIAVSPQDFEQQVLGLLEKPVITVHLRDQTISILTSQVLKVEVKPPLSGLAGEGIFPNSERVTALTRAGR